MRAGFGVLACIITLSLGAGIFSAQPASAQTAESIQPRVYVDQTGQIVEGAFLKAWPQWGGPDEIGWPITSLEQVGDNSYTQWFESIRFTLKGKALAEAAPEDIKAAPLGREYAERMGYFDTIDAFKSQLSAGENARYFLSTRHTIANGFRTWWETDENGTWAGRPISEEFSLNGKTYQFFENVALTWTPEDEVQLAPIGTLDALTRGKLGVKQAKPEDVTSYWDGYFIATGLVVGEKWIDVNLSTFTLTAYEGDYVFLQTPVVVGAAVSPTVDGMFHVYWKLVSQDMRGAGWDGTEYFQPDVPFVMYFFQDFALHGAYWRSGFGYAASHGCVNIPTHLAEQLYYWTPYGTRVWVHY